MKAILWCLVSGALAMSAPPAWAGMCEEEYAAEQVEELEAYAKKPGKGKPYLDHICMDTAATVPKLTKRVIAACTKIVEREADFTDCIEWSVKFGAKQLGAVDLFERTKESFKIEPFTYGSQTMAIYEALGDARSVPLVREAWQAALADKRAKQDRHSHTFRVWRHAAIRIFAKLGGAEESSFLETQKGQITDKGLKKAIDKAIAEIRKRAA